ncbi:MAG: adenylyl-sulfate kinase [Bacteriovorax sp.]|jgi:bifunctional enzyme CysN/CysC
MANISKEQYISRAEREQRTGQKGIVFWFCGLSGAGKSTIARAFERKLFDDLKQVYVLDGDNLRHGLNSDLKFSMEDRNENLRRLAHVAEILADAGFIVLVPAISPLKCQRDLARKIISAKFVEVYVSTPLETCIERDVKGLYKKAKLGEIPNMTGITSPFEIPENPDVVIQSVDEIERLFDCVDANI